MKLAKLLSLQSSFRVRIGAVAVKGKSVIGVGFNKPKTHLLISKDSHRKLHAEVSCVLGCERHLLVGATMYVYRENRSGQPAICKPCSFCQAVLREAGVRRAYYVDPSEEGNVGCLDFEKEKQCLD